VDPTQRNPTHQNWKILIQPYQTQPKPTQPIKNSETSTPPDPTQPNSPKTEKPRPNPT